MSDKAEENYKKNKVLELIFPICLHFVENSSLIGREERSSLLPSVDGQSQDSHRDMGIWAHKNKWDLKEEEMCSWVLHP